MSSFAVCADVDVEVVCVLPFGYRDPRISTRKSFFLVLLGDDICSMCVTSVSDSLLGSQVQPSLNVFIFF